MGDTTVKVDDERFQRRLMDSVIRIGLLALLIAWCFNIVKPFIMPVLWGAIMAVALYPLFKTAYHKLGDRQKLTATLITLVALAILIIPTVMLSGSLVDGVQTLTQEVDNGTLAVPPPADKVKEWPLIGEQAYSVWAQASRNLGAFLQEYETQVAAAAGWFLGLIAGAGKGILMFVISILIAGAFLVYAESGSQALERVATRIVSDSKGRELLELAGATIRSVAQGVLGVALIQAILAGIGLMLVGVPYAGLWALLVLLLAIIQLPPVIVLGPIIIYVFSVESTVPAVLFMIWALIVSGSDTFLKPLFLGRGMDIPMLVILLGAIGGMIMSGIIGLFVGAVVLAVGYTLFMAWLEEEDESSEVVGGE
jgi:predicted PurR-regulated permease PerM